MKHRLSEKNKGVGEFAPTRGRELKKEKLGAQTLFAPIRGRELERFWHDKLGETK